MYQLIPELARQSSQLW